MSDILMIADPGTYRRQKTIFKTLWFSLEEFYEQEKLVKAHDDVLWQSFHTHGKFMNIVRHARWYAVAVDKNNHYISSAFIVEIGQKWLLEYLMTNPTKQSKGAGSAIMNRIMQEAKKRKMQWIILNCDPNKNNGQLPAFYAKFGFKKVE